MAAQPSLGAGKIWIDGRAQSGGPPLVGAAAVGPSWAWPERTAPPGTPGVNDTFSPGLAPEQVIRPHFAADAPPRFRADKDGSHQRRRKVDKEHDR